MKAGGDTQLVSHRNQQRISEYRWLVSNGESHEQALRQVGLTQQAYEKITERE